MKTNFRFTFFAIFLILAMCLGMATNVRSAFADGSTPPPTVAPIKTEVTPTDVPVATDVPVDATAEPVITEPLTDPAGGEVVAALLGQVPSDTGIVVLDENGNPLPLVSQEAAEIIALPDPQFCPTGSLPGSASCSPVRVTIQEAVNDAKSSNVAGTVYIQSGTFTETVTIADFSAALTLQGVFSLSPYVVITNPATRPTINGRILIQDGADAGTVGNTANITLANLIINNSDTTSGDDPAIFADANTAAITLINLDVNGATNGNSGVSITNHAGSVLVAGVDVTGTNNVGAIINNTAGTGAVTIYDSVFDQNTSDGLQVTSRGAITLVNVTASNNGDQGAVLNNNQGTSTGSIEIVKSSFINNNSDGLVATSNGNITLVNVTATDNGTVAGNNNGDGVNLSFPTAGTHSVTICSGTYNNQGGTNDFNVQITNGDTLTRTTNLSPYTNWSTSNSGAWNSIVAGTGLCNFADTDGDQIPDQWDTGNDLDGDGVSNINDLCPVGAKVGTDTDGDGCKDTTEDTDNDNDTIRNTADNCALVSNANQANADGDALGDVCDPDDDNDTVLDGADLCANTPINETADANGCSPSQKDTDSDGVKDSLDQCPNTPASETPDANGCSPSQKDTDSDGVKDSLDQCPNTPANETPDANGCSPSQKDTDSDGVNDALDKCTNTPANETPDANGCSPSQRDTDGDTVSDAIDQCANTPINETADAKGCSSSQKDTDGDGVNDTLDQCVNTPVNETADANGCSPSQKDTDSDGVNDAIDQCPNTPVNETADASGCSPSQQDIDKDGVVNTLDNCPAVANPTQTDTDADGAGNACDTTPNGDTDGDGVDNVIDNCPAVSNAYQADADDDGIGDSCDSTPNGSSTAGSEDIGPVVTADLGANEEGNQGLIPVTGGEATALNCVGASTLLQKAEFLVSFSSFCGYSALLTEVPEAGIPNALPEGSTYVGGLDVVLIDTDGQMVKKLPSGSQVTIIFQTDNKNASLTVLFWNATLGEWVEKDATLDSNGRLTITGIDAPGTFVIVNKPVAVQSEYQPVAKEDTLYSLVSNWFNSLSRIFNNN